MVAFASVYNGKGYMTNGYENPYIFSGTNLYTKGKYVEVNVNGEYVSKYDAELVDKQPGVYQLIKSLFE